MFNRSRALIGSAMGALVASMTAAAITSTAPFIPNNPNAAERRSRGAQAKPAKRPNMRHVSKRVRRKHRRAQ
jgi:hypothetical protein